MRTFTFNFDSSIVTVLNEGVEVANIEVPSGFLLGEEGSNVNLVGSVHTELLNQGIVGLTGDEKTLLVGSLNQALK